MKAALYLRVSTDKQTVENQRADLMQLAKARGWEPVTYEETGSAVKARPVFDALLRDAHAGKVGAVVVWRLDRLHRSMQGAINDVLALDEKGCVVVSVKESWLDTSGPVRKLLVAIFGWVAECERETLIERTRAGIARARAQGKHLGRPRVADRNPVILYAAVAAVVDLRMPLEQAARHYGIARSTLQRAVAARRKSNGADPTPEPAPPPKNPA